VDNVQGDLLLFKTALNLKSSRSPNAIENDARLNLNIPSWPIGQQDDFDYSVGAEQVKNKGGKKKWELIKAATEENPLTIWAPMNLEFGQRNIPIPLNTPMKMMFRHAKDAFRLNSKEGPVQLVLKK
jgi:hypothetical protein